MIFFNLKVSDTIRLKKKHEENSLNLKPTLINIAQVFIEEHYLPHRKSPGVNGVNARKGIDMLSFPEAAVAHPRVSGDWHVSVGDTSGRIFTSEPRA